MTKDTIKSRLRAARALIDQPEKWTQGALHRDAQGRRLDSQRGRVVVSRCATGAIMDACGVGEAAEAVTHLECFITYYGGISSWNDEPGRTHADVMLAFDRAIADTHPD